MSEPLYIDTALGIDANTGTSQGQPWSTLTQVSRVFLNPGDSILLKRGQSWNGTLTINDDGSVDNPINIGDYGSGVDPIIYALELYGDYTSVQNITVDHNMDAGDAVRLGGARHAILRNMEIKNGLSDGIDGDDADEVVIDNLLIHHFLAGASTNQLDAHGIVFTDTQGITIQNTEVHHVSGDSFQTDPDGDTDTADDILIEDCYFWTGPLQANFNTWNVGEIPGGNAIETKMVNSNWESVPRMQLTIRNLTCHGFINDGFISNRAAFNMKEKIEAVFDGVTVYDSEIAFRLHGTRGNANVTVKNALIYNVEKAIRAEDNLGNLKIYNSTFGNNSPQFFEIVAGDNSSTWDVKNNVFVGGTPHPVTDVSNLVGEIGDFVDMAANDYRLTGTSGLVGSGVTLAEVTVDRDGQSRQPPYDVGAYEYLDPGNSSGTVNSELYLEAEDGTLIPPMKVGVLAAPQPSAGAYIFPDSEQSSNGPVAEAVYTIEILRSGAYYLWLRMYGPTPTNDALYAGFDGAFDRAFPSQNAAYEWVRVEVPAGDGNYSHILNQGNHQVVIGHGESLTRAD